VGEIADELVDGFRCRCCGEVIDEDEPGHSRLCRRVQSRSVPRRRPWPDLPQRSFRGPRRECVVAMIEANLGHPGRAISLGGAQDDRLRSPDALRRQRATPA